MSNRKQLYKISFALVIIGAINLGIYGLTAVDVLDYVFAGNLSFVAEIIDTLIGFAGIYLLYKYFSTDKATVK